jgi:hypothetical protein
MMGWLKEDHAAGKLSDADFATALQEMAEQADVQLKPDTRTPSQKEHDATFPPAKPQDYSFPQHGDPDHMTPDMKAADAMSRGWLATGLFTREHGSALATIADRVAAEIEHYSPEQHELFARSERLTLEHLWGPQTDANIGMVKSFVSEVAEKSPELIHMLNATGLGNSSQVIVQLYHHCERLNARNGEA